MEDEEKFGEIGGGREGGGREAGRVGEEGAIDSLPSAGGGKAESGGTGGRGGELGVTRPEEEGEVKVARRGGGECGEGAGRRGEVRVERRWGGVLGRGGRGGLYTTVEGEIGGG